MICTNDKQQTKKLRSSAQRAMCRYDEILCLSRLMECHQHMERVQRKHERFLFVVIKRKPAFKKEKRKKRNPYEKRESFLPYLALRVYEYVCVHSFSFSPLSLPFLDILRFICSSLCTQYICCGIANVPFQLRCEKQTKWKNGAPDARRRNKRCVYRVCIAGVQLTLFAGILIIYKSICKVEKTK